MRPAQCVELKRSPSFRLGVVVSKIYSGTPSQVLSKTSRISNKILSGSIAVKPLLKPAARRDLRPAAQHGKIIHLKTERQAIILKAMARFREASCADLYSQRQASKVSAFEIICVGRETEFRQSLQGSKSAPGGLYSYRRLLVRLQRQRILSRIVIELKLRIQMRRSVGGDEPAADGLRQEPAEIEAVRQAVAIRSLISEFKRLVVAC